MKYLGITESTYYDWINDGKLKPCDGSGQDYYYESGLLILKAVGAMGKEGSEVLNRVICDRQNLLYIKITV